MAMFAREATSQGDTCKSEKLDFVLPAWAAAILAGTSAVVDLDAAVDPVCLALIRETV